MSKETTPQLERVLTLRDLVLFNLVAVIGIGWVATAAKAGPSALTLWLLAAILFFVPQGLAVIQLSSSFPAEGGIYAWTKKEFGEGHGFVCGWCYWINNVLFYPTLLLAGAVSATYVIGHGESGLANNWTYVLPFTLIADSTAWHIRHLDPRSKSRRRFASPRPPRSAYLLAREEKAVGLIIRLYLILVNASLEPLGSLKIMWSPENSI